MGGVRPTDSIAIVDEAGGADTVGPAGKDGPADMADMADKAIVTAGAMTMIAAGLSTGRDQAEVEEADAADATESTTC